VDEMGRACSSYIGRGSYTEFWWDVQKERDHWKDFVVDGKVLLKWILQIKDSVILIGFIWPRIWTSSKLL
jgi:hypothetical protein